MVPVRLKLQGFLSYREAQEFDFEGRRLWMLSGDNGSGKSSVFDAMTFALFKEHRLGSQDAVELINRHADQALVEFTFRVGDRLYKAQRGVHRQGGKANRLLLFWDGTNWHPFDGSDGDAGFKKHLANIIGLNFEAFTSSILLRQGKSDQIIEAKPTERFNLLKQIVDLSEYEMLAKRAQDYAQTARQKHDIYSADLSRLPVVTEDQIAAAVSEQEVARTAKLEADKNVEALTILRKQAEDFARWEAERKRLEDGVGSASALINNASGIRVKAERRQVLDHVYPLLNRLLKSRGDEADATARINLEEKKQNAVRTAAHEALGNAPDDSKLLAVIEARLRQSEAAYDDLALLRELFAANATALTARSSWQDCVARSKALPEPQPFETACAVHIKAFGLASTTREKALERLGAARAAAQAAEEQRLRFTEAGDEGACRYCGQTLTPEQYASHAVELDQDCRATVAIEVAAKSDSDTADLQYKDAQTALEAARRAHNKAVQAAQNAETLAGAAEQAWQSAVKAACDVAKRIPPARQAPSGRPTVPADASIALDNNRWLDATNAYPAENDLFLLDEEAGLRTKWSNLRDRWRDANSALQHAQEILKERKERCAQDEAVLKPEWRSHPAASSDIASATFEIEALEQECLNLGRALDDLAALKQAEHDVLTLRAKLEQMSTQIATVLDAGRRPVEDVEAILATARTNQRNAEQRVSRADQDLQNLKTSREDREKKEEEVGTAAVVRGVAQQLSNLLGKDGLQRDLLRGAEAGIVYDANRALSAFSGGALRLEANNVEDASDSALDLVCWNEETTEKPLPLRLLSGSQRFRVSVALALGIGQYALSGSDAKVRSVIIDEGFGSLDARGLGDMAEEIKLLGGELERIIVVSHQEVFAAAFPDRYHIRLEEGTSRIERIEADRI